jgi:arabinan endo-1,5-alpha-L-arabinosidase
VRTLRILIVALLGVALTAAPAEAGANAGGRIAADPVVHDPTVIKQGRWYYAAGTGGDPAVHTYLPMMRSADLVHWTPIGSVFTGAPAWIGAELGSTPETFWAPDLSFFDGEYHLYYAASTFGSNNSVIGLATARTLDPADPRAGWTDRGLVVRSRGTDDFNAIDPELVLDAHGQPWLAFGSFWDGIKMRRLDRRTGLPATGDSTLYALASRGGASIEAASITRHGGFYYLFASFDFCCRGVDSDYRVVVGRSRDITGPYVDRAGVPMSAGGGTEVLRGYDEFRGTGGGDVFGDRFAHHYYDAADAGTPKLSIRTIQWSGGWPALGDPLSGSSRIGRGGAYFQIVNRATGLVVDNPTCGYEGADIRMSAAPAGACGQWRLDDRGTGTSLLNRFSNKVAEVAACVNAEGARVAQWGWLNNDCQKFRVVATGAGWSRIESRLNGRVLEAADCGGAGSGVQTVTWTGSDCQQFRLDPVGDVLITGTSGRQALRIGGDRLWRFVPRTDGWFSVVGTGDGRPLAHAGRRLVLGPRGAVTPESLWRIEVTGDGGYRLVDRTGIPAVTPGDGGTDRLLLLAPH